MLKAVFKQNSQATVFAKQNHFALCVIVAPEVDLRAGCTRVMLGIMVTLTCSLIRANPIPTTYTWTNVNTSTVISETSNTLTLLSISMADLVTYRCETTNFVGTSMDTITIELGGQSHVPHVMVCYSFHSFLMQLVLA